MNARAPAWHGLGAALSALPWCCILPAVLSLASLGGALTAGVWLRQLAWPLLPLSALLLGRVFWLLYRQGQGVPWSRRITWAAALAVAAL